MGAHKSSSVTDVTQPSRAEITRGHDIVAEDYGETYGGCWAIVRCSCGQRFQEGPDKHLTDVQARRRAHESWDAHTRPTGDVAGSID
jgi:hypothetical protein